MREIIEKTVWDAVSYQGSLMYLSYAQDEGDGVCQTGSSQSNKTKAAWDVGAAMIIGDGYHSVLGRAQKRGVEFGTVGPAGVSKAYEKIMKLLRDGQEEKSCNDPNSDEDLHEIYEKIEAQMRIVYCQSILKYAYKIDKELISNGSPKLDTVAEGQAMYRVIAGDIRAKGTSPPPTLTASSTSTACRRDALGTLKTTAMRSSRSRRSSTPSLRTASGTLISAHTRARRT